MINYILLSFWSVECDVDGSIPHWSTYQRNVYVITDCDISIRINISQVPGRYDMSSIALNQFRVTLPLGINFFQQKIQEIEEACEVSLRSSSQRPSGKSVKHDGLQPRIELVTRVGKNRM